jgi:hypothetical protein
MKRFVKFPLFILALVLFAATSSFAVVQASSYDVSINTTDLSGTSGYLYLQYLSVNGADSTATVSGFATDGVPAANSSTEVIDGSAVTGTLPGTVVFANTNGTNDYNHAITFGSIISFLLSLNNLGAGEEGGSNTFSLGLFQDELGEMPLLTVDGTLFTVSLMNNGSVTSEILASQASANPVPVPAAVWLLGSGLAGLVGFRKKIKH